MNSRTYFRVWNAVRKSDHQTEQAGRGVESVPSAVDEREKAVQHAIDVMGQGLPWGGTLRKFKREEMHKQ